MLPNTTPLETGGDLALAMVEGIRRFLLRETRESPSRRPRHRDRARLRQLIGAADPRPEPRMELVAAVGRPSLMAEGAGYAVHAVRWPALEGVHGEGLLLQPEHGARARVIGLPDADWTPEMLVGLQEGVPEGNQFARRLAESGCQVLVPALIDRADTWSGNAAVRMTNQPHREFIYRMAFEVGRHVIGYEVQKLLAVVDWLTCEAPDGAPIGVIGYGEGGLLALYAAALDQRIHAAAVSGYFQERDGLWEEPIYRNVWRLLAEFGDAQIAALVAPRTLIIEACQGPEVEGPPEPRDGRAGAAPGRLVRPPIASIQHEFARAAEAYRALNAADRLRLVSSGDGNGPPGCEETLQAFLAALTGDGSPGVGPQLLHRARSADCQARSRRQFGELCEFTQRLLRRSPRLRERFWESADASSVGRWLETMRPYRKRLWDDLIGRLPAPSLPPNPRTRLWQERPCWTGYEVVLDVWPDVFAYGILLVPRDLREAERRPVVVCQHGLEGRARDAVGPSDNPASQSFGGQLADRGFVVYAPQNPYIGGNAFRQLQRLADPLGLTLFSVIVRQHERALEWLSSLPFVDPARIGLYGISYGGVTAMRVPALLEQYALSICSANFNDWAVKVAAVDEPYSYMLTGEYEMPEWDLAHTYNYADMAGLIAPRPFMVERGHSDGVGVDEVVCREYAKVRRLYTALGIPQRTEIEFFDGGHEIHAEGTFRFLHRHLDWPEPARG